MLINYLKTAIRNLLRNRLYSFINILGLSVGLVSCIILTFYVLYELSYDKHFPNSDRVHRLVIDLEANDWAISAFPIGNILNERFPQIEKFTRIKPINRLISKAPESEFVEERVFYADSTVFDFFNIRLIRGNLKNIFVDDHTILISEEKAKMYFGNEDPIGKKLFFQGTGEGIEVKGVFKSLPVNSHFHPEFLCNSNLFEPMRSDFENPWSYLTSHYTYFLISSGTDLLTLENDINQYMGEYHDVPEDERANNLKLQALTNIHLKSNRGLEIEVNGNERNVYIFSTIAFFILLIASINFMNLSTAQSLKRAKEVGIRKTIGGNKLQLIFQFLGESLIITFIAIMLSALLLTLIIPEFNALANKDININPLNNPTVIPIFLGLALVVGILSGLYPAFVLSSFAPVKVLKGNFSNQISGKVVRQVLVVLQFCIAFIIMVGTFVVKDQLGYMQNKDLGFKLDNLLILKLPSDSIGERNLKTEMLKIPEIENVTRFVEKPGYMVRTTSFWHEGAESEDGSNTYAFSGDSDLDKVLNLEILRGDFFEEETDDPWREFVINEAAAKSYGWHIDSVIGKRMEFGNHSENPGRVIGLVKDFHFKHLEEEIEPLVLHRSTNFEGRFMALKLNTKDLSTTIDKVSAAWNNYIPDIPFKFEFMDEEFARLFEKEQTLFRLFALFSGLAIFVACLGLFGLASFTIQQKRKSLAVHKVLGATFGNLINIFSKEFMILIGLGVLVGIPISWYFMDEWLSNFAYRIELGPGIFILAFLSAAAISFMAISYHAIRAVRENPVKSLKEE